MKYFTLFEISQSFIIFFLFGLASDFFYHFTKVLLHLSAYILKVFWSALISAFGCKGKCKYKFMINNSIMTFIFEFSIVVVYSLVFFIFSYYLLDGSLRLFSFVCYLIGFECGIIVIRYIGRMCCRREPSYLNFAEKVMSFLFRILLLPIEFFSRIIIKWITPIFLEKLVTIKRKKNINVEHNSQNSIVYIKKT